MGTIHRHLAAIDLPKRMRQAEITGNTYLRGEQMTKSIFSGELVPSNVRLPGIHGLRAVAALMVIVTHVAGAIVHCIPHQPAPYGYPIVAAISPTGVHLFFVLSAFSLATSSNFTGDGVTEYVIKRYFRIAPLFYLAMIAAQILFGWKSIGENLLNVIFAFNLDPQLETSIALGGWTVGVEMIFYALFPLIALTCKTTRSLAVLSVIGMIVTFTAHRVLFNIHQPDSGSLFNASHYSFISNCGAFFLGLLAHSIYRENPGNHRLSRYALIGAFIFLMVAVMLPINSGHFSAERPAVLILFVCYGLLTLSQALKPSRLLSSSLMQHLGERSYSLYLVQLPVTFSMGSFYASVIGKFGVLAGYLISATLSVAIIFILANLTYHLVEVPGVNLGRRIINRRRHRALSAPSPTIDLERSRT